MATWVETPDCGILLDPGVSLAPVRYGLPPHPWEIQRMNEQWAQIRQYMDRADILVVTHYHYDHFDPTEPEGFQGKILLMKHPTRDINSSQRQRARRFLQALGKGPRQMVEADGRSFRFGNTEIICSPPVLHGPSTRLGFVIQILIRSGDFRFLFTSDIQGPCRREAFSFLLACRPHWVYLDGPMTYLLRRAYTPQDLERSLQFLETLAQQSPPLEGVILDHHLVRDVFWQEHLTPALEAFRKKGVRVVTAAEFLGVPVEPLEALRPRLYQEAPDAPSVPILRNPDFALVRVLHRGGTAPVGV